MVFVLSALINMRHLLAAMPKMSNIALMLVILLSITLVGTALAQFAPTPLSKSQIRNEMFGHLFTGEYSNGGRWAERLNGNLTSVYVEDGRPIHGHMDFQGSNLCFEYPNRTDLEGGCFEIWKRGQNCFDFYSTNSVASLEERRWGRAWMARAWISNQPSTCKSDLIS